MGAFRMLSTFVNAAGGELILSSPPELGGASVIQMKFLDCEPRFHLGVILEDASDVESVCSGLGGVAMALAAQASAEMEDSGPQAHIFVCEDCSAAMSVVGSPHPQRRLCPHCLGEQAVKLLVANRRALARKLLIAARTGPKSPERIAEVACDTVDRLVMAEEIISGSLVEAESA